MATLRPLPRKRVHHDKSSCKDTYINNRMRMFTTKAPVEITPSPPIMHFDSYVRDMQRTDPARVEEIIAKQKRAIEYHGDMKYVHTKKSDWVAPNTLHPEIEKLYTEYYSKQTKPPIEIRAAAFIKAGYPESIVDDMIRKHVKRESNKNANDAFIAAIFGSKPAKKETAPKKKTLKQLLNIKTRVVKYATNDDYEDEVEDEE